MTNIYFLLQCQYINKRKGYENISKGSFNFFFMFGDQSGEFLCGHWEGQKNGMLLGVCLKVDFSCRVIFAFVRVRSQIK